MVGKKRINSSSNNKCPQCKKRTLETTMERSNATRVKNGFSQPVHKSKVITAKSSANITQCTGSARYVNPNSKRYSTEK